METVLREVTEFAKLGEKSAQQVWDMLRNRIGVCSSYTLHHISILTWSGLLSSPFMTI